MNGADDEDPDKATDEWTPVDDDDELTSVDTTVLPVVAGPSSDDESTDASTSDDDGDHEDGDDLAEAPADQTLSPVNEEDGDEPDEPEGVTRRLMRNPLRLALAAAIIGALVAGGLAVAFGVADDVGGVGGTGIGEGERLATNAFTESTAGDCLTWPADDPGNPALVLCEEKHRFEVAGPVNTAILPGSEFGESALWPGVERFATIRDEQCPVIVEDYLDGRLDPTGRFSVGMMYPSEVQWDKGARELRCGLQESGPDSTPIEFSGRVADQDQGFTWPPGTCIGIDGQTRQPTVPVDCTEPHAFQTTGVVDLAARFGNKVSGRPWPNDRTQNDFLRTVCPAQAERFLGGKEKFDATTLNVNWSTVSEPSWLAGSRKVVCFLGLPDQGGFATLVGDARETLLINGKVPDPGPQAPPGRAVPTPVPLPDGVVPNDSELPAPAGG